MKKVGCKIIDPNESQPRKEKHVAPAHGIQWVRALSSKRKGRGFDSQSGHTPRLRVWSPARVHMKSNQLTFLTWILSLLSLPSPVSKINKYVLGRGLKRKNI